MHYADLTQAIRAYREGRNVMAQLRETFGTGSNTDDIVEIAYDLQAGTYASHVRQHADQWRAYCGELASVLAPLTRPGDITLDVGTGELTTLSGVAPVAFAEASAMLACDISFSRLKVGKSFAREALGPSLVDRVTAFVGNMFGLPFADSSIDVVWTSHAIEPNGGREAAAVAELLRVTRGHLVLFEPSYEANTDEGRRRMDSLGYVKGLPATIEALGGRIIDRLAVRNVANPLNPTLALVCVPPRPRAATLATGAIAWTCPATGTALQWRETCFFSPQSLLAYPVLEGVPLLRVEHAVMASALA